MIGHFPRGRAALPEVPHDYIVVDRFYKRFCHEPTVPPKHRDARALCRAMPARLRKLKANGGDRLRY